VIKLNSKLAQAYAGRGRAFANKRDFDRAIADLSEAIRIDPKLPRAYSNRALVYIKKREFTLAVADFDQAIRPHLSLDHRGSLDPTVFDRVVD